MPNLVLLSENLLKMKKLLEFLISSIVQNPKDVSVIEESNERSVILTAHVNPEDIKIVIGREGRTIKALRDLVKVKAIKEKKRVDLKVDR